MFEVKPNEKLYICMETEEKIPEDEDNPTRILLVALYNTRTAFLMVLPSRKKSVTNFFDRNEKKFLAYMCVYV